MNEELYSPAPAPEKPRKLKRHALWAVIPIALVLMLLGQILGSYAVGVLESIFELSPAIQFSLMYLSFIGIDFVIIAYCSIWEKEVLRSFLPVRRGGGQGNTWKLFGIGLLLGFATNAVCILIAWLHGDLDFSVGRFEPLYLLFSLFCVLIQSGAEELLTRGYMFGALRQRYPLWVAIAANSLFFGALHLLNNGITLISFLDIVLIAVVYSLVMVYYDSIWMCIALHTAWNFTQSLLFGLPNSGIVSEASFLHLEGSTSSFAYDAVFGVEGTVISLLVNVLLGLGVVLLGRKKRAADVL